MPKSNKDLNELEFQFLMWLQCDRGIDTVEKYEALSKEEYVKLKMEFLEFLSDSTVIDLRGSEK